MRPVSIHTAAWRYPGAFPDANFNLGAWCASRNSGARPVRRFFHGRPPAVMNMPMTLKRSATVTSFDPLTLLPALAMVTDIWA